MLKRFLFMLLVLGLSGCATGGDYDPLRSSANQTLLVNSSALKRVTIGATLVDVHNIMGDTLTVGYSHQKTSADNPYEPVMISNPYRKEIRTTPKGECTVEYYVTAIHQPDGVVSDDELMPLVFCGGVLTSKGWDSLK